jgi:multimeric flavodoxin WrbA
MNIIGYSGSPHKSGNTAWAVKQILDGAKRSGPDPVLFTASELDVQPCRGCFGCKAGENGCVIKDDMQKVYGELRDAEALVFASPVYMGQMTGQAKVFMDRLFPTNSPKFSPYYKEQAKKKLLLVFTQGNPDPSKFQTYFDYTRKLFEILDYDVAEPVIISGTRSSEAKDIDGIAEHLTAIGTALGV